MYITKLNANEILVKRISSALRMWSFSAICYLLAVLGPKIDPLSC